MKCKVIRASFNDENITIFYTQEVDSKEILARSIIIGTNKVRPMLIQFFQTLMDKIFANEDLESLTEEEIKALLDKLLNQNSTSGGTK